MNIFTQVYLNKLAELASSPSFKLEPNPSVDNGRIPIDSEWRDATPLLEDPASLKIPQAPPPPTPPTPPSPPQPSRLSFENVTGQTVSPYGLNGRYSIQNNIEPGQGQEQEQEQEQVPGQEQEKGQLVDALKGIGIAVVSQSVADKVTAPLQKRMTDSILQADKGWWDRLPYAQQAKNLAEKPWLKRKLIGTLGVGKGLAASVATDSALSTAGNNIPGLGWLGDNRPNDTYWQQVKNNWGDSVHAGLSQAAYGAASAPPGLQYPAAISGAAAGLVTDMGMKGYGLYKDTSKDDINQVTRMVTGIQPNHTPNIDINGKLKEDPQKVNNRMLGAPTNVPVSSFGKTPLQSNIGSTQPTKDGPEDLGEMTFNMNKER